MMGLYRQQLFTQELLTLCPMMHVADPLLLTRLSPHTLSGFCGKQKLL